MRLEVDDLHAGYVRGIDILRGLSLIARSERLTTLIGANGVGKSTLLKCIVGQLRPHAGRITCAGAEITGLKPHVLPMIALIGAAKHPSPGNAEDGARPQPADQDAVRIDDIVIEVLTMAEVFPMFSTVHGADHPPDFDGAIDHIGIRRTAT